MRLVGARRCDPDRRSVRGALTRLKRPRQDCAQLKHDGALIGPKSDTPYVPPSSCPREETVGLAPTDYGFQSPLGASFIPTSEAVVQTPSGDYIAVMAGSVRSRPDFGVLLLTDVPADPCAAAIQGAPRSPTSLFRVTAANGPVVLTALSGTTVTMQDDAGSSIDIDVAKKDGLTPDTLE